MEDFGLIDTALKGGIGGLFALVIYLNHLSQKDTRSERELKDQQFITMQENFAKTVQKNSDVLGAVNETMQNHLKEVRVNIENNTRIIERFGEMMERQNQTSNNLLIAVESLKQQIRNK